MSGTYPEENKVRSFGSTAASSRRPFGVLLSVVVAVAVGCGGSKGDGAAAPTTARPSAARPTTTLAAVVPAGYTGFSSSVDHFTVAVPATWRQVDPSSPGATQTVQDLVKANPAFSSVLGSGDLASKGIKFLAANPTTGSSVNVVVKPALGARDSDLDGLIDDLKAQYQALGAAVTGTRTVPLAGHSALQIDLELKIAATAGSRASTIRETQDLVAANDLVYIVTLAGADPALPAIAETLRV